MSTLTEAAWMPASLTLTLAFELAWKSSVWLALVAIVVRAVMRRRAPLATLVANAGLIGLLLLPVSVRALPALALSCLPAREIARPVDPLLRARSPAPVVAGTSVATIDPSRTPALATGVPVVDPSPETNAGPRPVEAGVPPSLRPEPGLAEAPHATGLPARPAMQWPRLEALAVGVYAVGVALLLFRLAGGLIAVARLRRGSVAVDEPAWCAALVSWRTRLGIGRPVGLAWSAGVGVPVVVGWRRPLILLPASAAALESKGHADAIVLHELAHVRRGDFAWNVIQRLVVAVYWVHPLAWLLARLASETRERACDDHCIHEMGGSTAYRATLLAVASGLARRPGPALGLAMARTPRLARRLADIDRSRGASRCLPRWPARLAIATLGFLLATTLGTLQLTRRVSADEPPKVKVFRLRVVSAESGKPVPNAKARVWIALNDFWTSADDQGRLEIRHSTGPADTSFGVDVWGDGYAMQRHHWGQKPGEPVPAEATVSLRPGETLGGLVQDDQGRPIPGAVVYLWSHKYKKADPHEIFYDLRAITGSDGRWTTSGAPQTTGELLGFHIDHPDFLSDRDYSGKREKPTIADLRAGKALSVMIKGVPIEGRVLDADGQPVAGATVSSASRPDELGSDVREFAVTTDAAGHFRTGQVRAATYYLVAQARGHAPGEQSVKVEQAVPQVEIRLGRPRVFSGRVVDPDGKPIEGAFVNVDTWREYRFLGVYLYSDRDGRFRWEDAPEDPLIINVHRQGHTGINRERVEPNAREVRFTLKPSLSIRGKITGAGTEQRVEFAKVQYAPVDPATGEAAAWTNMPTVGSGIGVYQGSLHVDIPVSADAYRIRINAEGYEPFVSRTFRRSEIAVNDYNVALSPARPGSGPAATVVRPDGRPLAGARVYRGVLNENNLSLRDGVVQSGRGSGLEVVTGPDGSFSLPENEKPWIVLILGDDCYAIASKDAIAASPKVQAKPYARVEGRYRIGPRPGSRLPVKLSGIIQNRATMHCVIFVHHTATTDDEGRFVFERVIPTTDLHVARDDRGDGPGRIWSLGAPVRVEPGATVQVALGGQGRSIVGRVEPPAGWNRPVNFTDQSRASIETNQTWTPYPLSLFRGKTSLQGSEWGEWVERWRDSPEGRDYRDRRVAVSVGLAPDGSFRIDDLPAGEYRFALSVNSRNSMRETGPFAHLVQVFNIPPIPGGRSDEPLDLGVFRLRPRVELKPGDPAPPFKVTTLDGKTLAVPGDFRGKLLLLDFGSRWDQQSAFQIVRLNDIHARFGNDPRLVILSLTLESDTPETRAYIAEKGEPWPQAIAGPIGNPIASAYGIHDWNSYESVLIGPDGRLISKEGNARKFAETVGEALGRK